MNIVSIHLIIITVLLKLFGYFTSLFHRQVSTKRTRDTHFYLILVRVERGGINKYRSKIRGSNPSHGRCTFIVVCDERQLDGVGEGKWYPGDPIRQPTLMTWGRLFVKIEAHLFVQRESSEQRSLFDNITPFKTQLLDLF